MDDEINLMLSFLLIIFISRTRQKAYLFQWIFAGGPILVCTVGLVTVLCIMIWSIQVLQRKMGLLRDSWRHPLQTDVHYETADVMRFSRRVSSIASSIVSLGGPPDSNSHNHGNPYEVAFRSSASSSNYSLPSRSRRRRLSLLTNQQTNGERDDLIKQAMLYTSSFLMIYLFPYIYHIIDQLNGSAPFFLVLTARILGPFQGVLNIIIYTRIRVSNICAESDTSWLSAFWLVVTSGVDHEIIARRQSNELHSPFANEFQRSSTGSMKSIMVLSKSKRRRNSVSFANDTDVPVDKVEQVDVSNGDESVYVDTDHKEVEKKTSWEANQDSVDLGLDGVDSKEEGCESQGTFDPRVLEQSPFLHFNYIQRDIVTTGKGDDQDSELLVVVDSSSEILECVVSDEEQFQMNNEASPHTKATNDLEVTHDMKDESSSPD